MPSKFAIGGESGPAPRFWITGSFAFDESFAAARVDETE
jgi:hypothetical protein